MILLYIENWMNWWIFVGSYLGQLFNWFGNRFYRMTMIEPYILETVLWNSMEFLLKARELPAQHFTMKAVILMESSVICLTCDFLWRKKDFAAKFTQFRSNNIHMNIADIFHQFPLESRYVNPLSTILGSCFCHRPTCRKSHWPNTIQL